MLDYTATNTVLLQAAAQLLLRQIPTAPPKLDHSQSPPLEKEKSKQNVLPYNMIKQRYLFLIF